MINGMKSWLLRGAGAAAFAVGALTPAAAHALERTDLYILQGEELYRVDEGNGAYTLIGANDDWEDFTSIVGDGSYGYAVAQESIWRVSFQHNNEGATELISDDDWTGPTQLAYGEYLTGAFPGTLVQSLIAWQGGLLYKVNTSTGAVAQLGSASWAGGVVMTYLNHNNNDDGNDLFVIHGDDLWRVNVNTGARTQLNGDWSDSTAITADATQLYIACQDHLYSASASTGSSTDLGDDWNTTTTLTFMYKEGPGDDWLYAIDGGDLYRVSPTTGSTWLLGSADDWPGFTVMTHRKIPIIQ